MAEGKQRAAWSHTSALLAMLANVNRGKKSKTFKPGDFDPYDKRATQRSEKLPGNVRMLKDVFINNAGRLKP